MSLSAKDADLINNARDGILKEVRDLLQEGGNVNAKDSDGETALTWACMYRHADVALEILKQKNVDVNIKNSCDDTALIWACKMSLADVALEILKRDNVNVNARNMIGYTALTWACKMSLADVALEILKRDNVDVNMKNSGDTALIWACCNGLSDIALEVLKRDNVDVNAKNSDGVTALIAASQHGHFDVVRELLQHNKVDVNAQRDTDGATALYIASQLGRVEVVRLLLQHNKVDVDVKNKEGSTALDVARLDQRYAVVRSLEAVEHDRKSLRNIMKNMPADPVELSHQYIKSCITDSKLDSRPFGAVVVVEDRYLPKKFVVKKIDLAHCDLDTIDKARKAFQNELSILKRFRHPNIIVLYGYNLNVNRPQQFLVYEYVARGSLDKFFKDDGMRARLSADMRLSIMFELARAVHFLHTGGVKGWKVFHCDIKSANICLTDDFTARLTDFGLAKFVPDENSDHKPGSFIPASSTEGAVVGTPGYMCPEYVYNQAMGYPCPYKAAYDVYSIGIVMAELILGCLNLDQTRKRKERVNVFQRYVEHEETVIVAGWTQLERDADDGAEWNSKSLQLVCEIAVMCMAPSPDERWRTSRFLPLLSKAINLQAGIHYSEPAGAGDAPPCAVCNLPCAVVKCSGESHALCSRCIEKKLLKGRPHTSEHQLSCLINDCSSPPFEVKDLRQHISTNVYDCIVATLESKLDGVNEGVEEGNERQLALEVGRCLPTWAKDNVKAEQFKLSPFLVVLTSSAVSGLKKLFRAIKGKKKYQVVFFCAHSGHPGHDPFEISVDKQWVVKVAPWLRIVLKIAAELDPTKFPFVNHSKKMKALIDELGYEGKHDDMQTLERAALQVIAEKANKEKHLQWKEMMVDVIDANGRTIWVKNEYKGLYHASV